MGWWGKLYEELGRGILWDKSGEEFVKPGEWNTYEIVAIGSHVRTRINGHTCVDLDDSLGARRGITAVQLHAGGKTEVRFRDFKLELDPKRSRTRNGTRRCGSMHERQSRQSPDQEHEEDDGR